MEIKKITFNQLGDGRGNLTAIEENQDIPFGIKRVYYIYDTYEEVERGFHAHKSLEQVVLCVHGSVRFTLDDGTERQDIILDKPNEGIYISNVIWREMRDFKNDAVLLVLASEHYTESDYIRNYEEFKKFVEEQKSNHQ